MFLFIFFFISARFRGLWPPGGRLCPPPGAAPLTMNAILQGSFSVKQIFVANFICIGNRYITDCILEDRTFPLSNVIALLLSCRP